MKRREWAILVLLIVGVAALEIFGAGNGSQQRPRTEGPVQEAPRPAESDPMAAYRTVRLHVTGMT